MMSKLLRDVFVSLGFLLFFFGVSFLFAGKTHSSLKNDKEFKQKQEKFLNHLSEIIQREDEKSALNVINSLKRIPNSISPLEKTVLRSLDTKFKAIRKILHSELNFSSNIRTAIMELINALPQNDRNEIFLEFPNLYGECIACRLNFTDTYSPFEGNDDYSTITKMMDLIFPLQI